MVDMTKIGRDIVDSIDYLNDILHDYSGQIDVKTLIIINDKIMDIAAGTVLDDLIQKLLDYEGDPQ